MTSGYYACPWHDCRLFFDDTVQLSDHLDSHLRTHKPVKRRDLPQWRMTYMGGSTPSFDTYLNISTQTLTSTPQSSVAVSTRIEISPDTATAGNDGNDASARPMTPISQPPEEPFSSERLVSGVQEPVVFLPESSVSHPPPPQSTEGLRSPVSIACDSERNGSSKKARFVVLSEASDASPVGFDPGPLESPSPGTLFRGILPSSVNADSPSDAPDDTTRSSNPRLTISTPSPKSYAEFWDKMSSLESPSLALLRKARGLDSLDTENTSRRNEARATRPRPPSPWTSLGFPLMGYDKFPPEAPSASRPNDTRPSPPALKTPPFVLSHTHDHSSTNGPSQSAAPTRPSPSSNAARDSNLSKNPTINGFSNPSSVPFLSKQPRNFERVDSESRKGLDNPSIPSPQSGRMPGSSLKDDSIPHDSRATDASPGDLPVPPTASTINSSEPTSSQRVGAIPTFDFGIDNAHAHDYEMRDIAGATKVGWDSILTQPLPPSNSSGW
ncbi:uncharacterized protein EI90DRAFT_3036277 [Cantharellus anzutake]|uniref:uncharacterized protein n=1 Tax=Cantharellus anzutake TaxID=1750568 RepID=UPI0019065F72|nr:uncharacterized protein EI90DRAFT_3036277 [Cantharellus anzutake]KAF8340637.1 hypothetical protein EI90DRAFT_3036277 [Cantharellus anzutake]